MNTACSGCIITADRDRAAFGTRRIFLHISRNKVSTGRDATGGFAHIHRPMLLGIINHAERFPAAFLPCGLANFHPPRKSDHHDNADDHDHHHDLDQRKALPAHKFPLLGAYSTRFGKTNRLFSWPVLL